MLKRLIEVALPLKEVSEQSAREKSIRHGHISTLHIWWARRPLAACRAIVFASLIPDPDDPECPKEFRTLVKEILSRNEFKPKNGDGSTVEDTPRNRCLEFIKYLVRWENSNKPEYIEPARKLIAAAHKILHPDSDSDAPKVLDPFAGGGAIPLEALRLGCEAHAIDLNPVAHLIELCTLVYPQKYGQPNSRPVPDYIKRLVVHNQQKENRTSSPSGSVSQKSFADSGTTYGEDGDIIPGVEITEEEYQSNPLSADVKYWGHWMQKEAQRKVGHLYPPDPDGAIPIAYLWARTVKSPNPQTPHSTPLLRHTWLKKKSKNKLAFSIVTDDNTGEFTFKISSNGEIDFDPSEGTVKQGKGVCVFSQTTIPNEYLRKEGKAGRIGNQLIAVVLSPIDGPRKYRVATREDQNVVNQAGNMLAELVEEQAFGSLPTVPDELIPKTEIRRLSVPLYGYDTFGKLFTPRQLVTVITWRNWYERQQRYSTNSTMRTTRLQSANILPRFLTECWIVRVQLAFGTPAAKKLRAQSGDIHYR
jgi:adenine-specific DNA methylase